MSYRAHVPMSLCDNTRTDLPLGYKCGLRWICSYQRVGDCKTVTRRLRLDLKRWESTCSVFLSAPLSTRGASTEQLRISLGE